jgi:hypothetical protein
MMGRVLDVLVLQPGEGLTANFLRVRTPDNLTANQWAPLEIAGLLQDVLVARAAERGITPG